MHGSQRRKLVNTTQINAVCSGSVRVLARVEARMAVEVRGWLASATAAKAGAKEVAEHNAQQCTAQMSAAQMKSAERMKIVAQMKKARRNRQAFIKFGCGGRI